MDIEAIREHALTLVGTTEDFPFGDEVLAFKVLGKIYMLINLERDPLSVNLKCEPTRALELRDQYEAVAPGYHMNKKHWNTVLIEGDVPDAVFIELIDHSYQRVVSGMTRKERQALEALG